METSFIIQSMHTGNELLISIWTIYIILYYIILYYIILYYIILYYMSSFSYLSSQLFTIKSLPNHPPFICMMSDHRNPGKWNDQPQTRFELLLLGDPNRKQNHTGGWWDGRMGYRKPWDFHYWQLKKKIDGWNTIWLFFLVPLNGISGAGCHPSFGEV